MFRLASRQGPSTFLNVEANLATIGKTAEAAADQDVTLLLFPELFLTGYNLAADAGSVAQPLDGPAARAAADIARSTGVALLYGYPERCGDALYNAAVLIDGRGQVLANYRKTHLFGPEEKRLFKPGQGYVTAELGGMTLGILVCYDVEFPEAVRALALLGAELVLVPTALSPPYHEIPTTLIRARAYENQVFLAYCNHTGQERGLTYIGQSAIVAPDGTDLARAGEVDEVLLTAAIDPSQYAESRRANTYLQDRRPELYGLLQQSGWSPDQRSG